MSTDLERLLDRQAIVDLLHTYCRNIDLGQADAAFSLFTEDCAADYGPSLGGAVRGREALRRALGAAATGPIIATRHMVSNIEVVFETDDLARGTTYLYAWHRFADGHPDGHIYGQYHDVFVRTDDGWRIAERRLEVAGESGFPLDWNPISRA